MRGPRLPLRSSQEHREMFIHLPITSKSRLDWRSKIRTKIDLKIKSNPRLAKPVEDLQREVNKRGKKAELPDSSTISVRDKAAFISIELSPLPLLDRHSKVRHMNSAGASLRIMQQTPIFDISCDIHIKIWQVMREKQIPHHTRLWIMIAACRTRLQSQKPVWRGLN